MATPSAVSCKVCRERARAYVRVGWRLVSSIRVSLHPVDQYSVQWRSTENYFFFPSNYLQTSESMWLDRRANEPRVTGYITNTRSCNSGSLRTWRTVWTEKRELLDPRFIVHCISRLPLIRIHRSIYYAQLLNFSFITDCVSSGSVFYSLPASISVFLNPLWRIERSFAIILGIKITFRWRIRRCRIDAYNTMNMKHSQRSL